MQPKDVIKSYFTTGSKPTEAQFFQLIDSVYSGAALYTDILCASAPGDQGTWSISNPSISICSVPLIFVNGILQIPTIHYSINTNFQITFNENVPKGWTVVAVYMIDL